MTQRLASIFATIVACQRCGLDAEATIAKVSGKYNIPKAKVTALVVAIADIDP